MTATLQTRNNNGTKDIEQRLKALQIDLSDKATSMRMLAEKALTLDQEVADIIDKIAMSMNALNAVESLDRQAVSDFWKEPYCILPKKGHDNEYWVIVPRFVPFNAGFLHSSTISYKKFVINKYMKWVGDVPKHILDQLKFKPGLPVTVKGDIMYTGAEHQNEAWEQFREHLHQRVDTDKIKIKAGHEFQLVADIIDSGGMPFPKIPVDEKDWRDWNFRPGKQLHQLDFKQVQIDAINEFIENFKAYGHVAVYWPTGFGKSVSGLKLLGHIMGRKLIVVPRTALIDQWKKRIREFYEEPQANEILAQTDIITYASQHKVANNHYTLGIIEEHHHFPANTYSKFAFMDIKYKFCNSATPYREDGREKYVLALGGYPMGLDWSSILESGVLNVPKITLFLFDNEREKMAKLEELLEERMKTIIYSFWIEYGANIAQKFSLPHVHGGTTDNLATIEREETVVASSVAAEGLSFQNIERIIEVAGHFGSRTEEGQMSGRLLHSKSDKQTNHYILATYDEMEHIEKRLSIYEEKGIKVQLVQ